MIMRNGKVIVNPQILIKWPTPSIDSKLHIDFEETRPLTTIVLHITARNFYLKKDKEI